MAKYHISPETGRPNICNPEKTGICKYATDGENPPHYDNKIEAKAAYEKAAAAEYGTTTTLTKRKTKQTTETEAQTSEDEPKAVKYSFVKEFKVLEENFNKDFDGIPTRFFKADLRGNKIMSRNLDLDKFNEISVEDKKAVLKLAYVDNQALAARLTSFTSSPKDLAMDDETVLKTAEEMGLTDIRKIENPKTLASLKSDRAWVATMGEKQIALTGSAVNSKNFASYRFRTQQEEFDSKKSFTYVDIRTLAGGKRILDKTDINVISEGVGENTTTYDDRIDSKLVTLQALKELEDAQYEGSNFISQKKYLKENANGNSARAWEDKKNPKESHVEAAKNSPLTKHFRKIEIDDDVDLEEFKRFENDYLEVVNRLPKVPKGKESELKIRKLGRHSAHGMYFPHKNIVAVDIRNSGSTVHELAHQYDLAIKGNASLRKEFKDVVSGYTKALRIPAGEPESRAEYLATPTEVLARGFESYASNELGIKNSLIDHSKFENYDHAPFKDPVLKEKMFNFIRGLYKEDEK